ncbi:MAG: PD-(D/E)XK nuclease family protein [Candidatus Obscuribacterales bacterium]|nr:PD-(D/E)XK nuclease family protein [Candidatus Obscuribacterales bacterium]
MKTLREYRLLYRAGKLTADDIREFFSRPENRNVSITDLQTLDCPHRFLGRRLGVRSKVTLGSAVGDACHIVAEHGGDMAACQALVEAKVAALPTAERQEAVARIEELVANRQELGGEDEADDENAKRESLHSLLDDGPGGCGWTFFIKPDQWTEYQDGKGRVLEVIEEKTGEHASRRHWEQLRFFAMVLKRLKDHRGSLRLTLRLWGGKNVLQQWYSYGEQQRDLEVWRAKIARIQGYINAGHFPTSADHRCDRCPLVEMCAAAKAYNQVRNGSAPRVIPLVSTTAASA